MRASGPGCFGQSYNSSSAAQGRRDVAPAPVRDVKADRGRPDEGEGALMNLDAKPEAITFDTGKTAVLVVDMQNDFGSKGGMLDRAGIDISGIQKAVGPTAKVLAAARDTGVQIIYLKMGYKPDLSDLGAPDSVNRVRHLRLGVGEKVVAPDGKESQILIRDTWNTDIVPELKPQPGDDIIYKTRFSGFFGTDLDARLKKLGVKHLVITGAPRVSAWIRQSGTRCSGTIYASCWQTA